MHCPQRGNVRIVKSDNAGLSWVTDTIRNTYSYMQTIGFIDSQHGWSGGLSTLFETLDGGLNWNPITVGTAYNRFFRVNGNTAFLSGDKIYKYSNGIPTASHQTEKNGEIHTLNVSPNPLNEVAEVEIHMGNKTYGKLQLYTADGKLLETLYEGIIEKGYKHFTLNCGRFDAQNLYLVLKTNEELVYRKLLKK